MKCSKRIVLNNDYSCVRLPWQILAVFLLCVFSSGCGEDSASSISNGDGNGQDDKVVNQTLEGIWYMQTYRGIIQSEPQDVEFGASGRYRGPAPNIGEVELDYEYDSQTKTYTIFSPDRQHSTDYGYTFGGDGVLTTWRIEGEGRVRLREFTRDPNGTEQHQQARAAEAGPYGGANRRSSQEHLRVMAIGAYILSQSSQDHYPASIGDLYEVGSIRPAMVIAPWEQLYLPDHFSQMEEAAQVSWINRNSSYVYLGAGHLVGGLGQHNILMFELVSENNLDQVAVADGYGAARRISYVEADEKIREQTGFSIAQWHNAESPGAGQMTLQDNESE